jgi:nucleoside-diphosphate-sugar epimerase
VIIGDGMIARAFIKSFYDSNDLILFASGVSNSKEMRELEFQREEALLLSIVYKKKIIYFSTCSIYDEELVDSPYVKHKLKIESLIEEKSKNYLILRLPQVVGFTKNLHTLTNFIFESMIKNKPINIWKYAQRNLIDIDDVVSTVTYIQQNKLFENRVINLASPIFTSTYEIVAVFEKILNKKALLSIEEKGGSYLIDISSVSQIYNDLDLVFNEQYLEKILYKYYGKI